MDLVQNHEDAFPVDSAAVAARFPMAYFSTAILKLSASYRSLDSIHKRQ
jgi:hypothetical protein